MRTFLFACLIAAPAFANEGGHSSDKPYAGLETRDIKGLSADDIAQLRQGAGWGLALPAELNGKPGPAHVLEHAEALNLSEQQKIQINQIYNAMKEEAIEVGKDLIAAERALSDAFAGDDLSGSELAALIDAAEGARARLRWVHLSRHLQTKPLLNDAQIQKYAILRGYADDPCALVPDGHDATMWRKHNGCE